jgi:hypothetical protein
MLISAAVYVISDDVPTWTDTVEYRLNGLREIGGSEFKRWISADGARQQHRCTQSKKTSSQIRSSHCRAPTSRIRRLK